MGKQKRQLVMPAPQVGRKCRGRNSAQSRNEKKGIVAIIIEELAS